MQWKMIKIISLRKSEVSMASGLREAMAKKATGLSTLRLAKEPSNMMANVSYIYIIENEKLAKFCTMNF